VAISADDLDDAREALRAAGHDVHAFRFEYVPYPRCGCGAGPPPPPPPPQAVSAHSPIAANAGARGWPTR
jgi:hypothetical protein